MGPHPHPSVAGWGRRGVRECAACWVPAWQLTWRLTWQLTWLLTWRGCGFSRVCPAGLGLERTVPFERRASSAPAADTISAISSSNNLAVSSRVSDVAAPPPAASLALPPAVTPPPSAPSDGSSCASRASGGGFGLLSRTSGLLSRPSREGPAGESGVPVVPTPAPSSAPRCEDEFESTTKASHGKSSTRGEGEGEADGKGYDAERASDMPAAEEVEVSGLDWTGLDVTVSHARIADAWARQVVETSHHIT
jgi:hypothetical protein